MNKTQKVSVEQTIVSSGDDVMSEEFSQNPNRESFFQRLEKIVSLSQIVRAFGACAIIVSMSLFMLQGWAEGNDVGRYLKLLAQTGLLTGAGFLLSFLIKEFKGARVFFGLALLSVVANFTILGSLSYSLFAMDIQLVDYPASMKWEVVESAMFLPTFLGALLLLFAVTYFSFSIFARKIAKPLTLSLLGLSAVLLIPVREPLIAVGLAAAALFSAWFLIKRILVPSLGISEVSSNSLVLTKETKASLGLLLLPGLIVLARAVSFYSIDELTLLAFSVLVYLTLRSVSDVMNSHGLFKRLCEVAQLGLSIFIATLVTLVLPQAWNHYDVFIGSLVFIAFAFEQLKSSNESSLKSLRVNITVFSLVPIMLFNAMLQYELIYSFQALLLHGLLFMLTLNATKSLNKLSISLSRIVVSVGFVIACLMVGYDIIQLASVGNWVIIGLSGAMLILVASLYERFGLKLFSN